MSKTPRPSRLEFGSLDFGLFRISRNSKFEFSPMRLLDRYIVRNFLQPYIYCIIGFLSIWLIFDISDNSSTIFDEHAPFGLVVQFYWTQIPQVLVILLPVSLLLALLFSSRPDVARERNRLDADRRGERAAACFPVAHHRSSHHWGDPSAQLFPRRSRRAGAQEFLRPGQSRRSARSGDHRAGLPQPDGQPNLVYRALSAGIRISSAACRSCSRMRREILSAITSRPRRSTSRPRKAGGWRGRRWSTTTSPATLRMKSCCRP